MENREKVLTIGPREWSPEASALLAQAFTHGSADQLGADVVAGRAGLFAVDDGERVAALFVLRVDGDEGVIVAAAGGVQGVDLTADVLPHVERMFSNVRRIRIHTARAGMAKKLARQGYAAAEIVLFKEVTQ